jgi:hypothetical protein
MKRLKGAVEAARMELAVSELAKDADEKDIRAGAEKFAKNAGLKPGTKEFDAMVAKFMKNAANMKKRKEQDTGPGGHVPDGTGPHGRGMGPGKGQGCK